jgi:hypothetical protein
VQRLDRAVSAWVLIGNILSSDMLFDMQVKANQAFEMREEIAELKAARERKERIVHPWTGVSKEMDYVLRHLVKTTAGREQAKKDREELTGHIESLVQKHDAFVSSLASEIMTHLEGAKMAAGVRKQLNAQMAH